MIPVEEPDEPGCAAMGCALYLCGCAGVALFVFLAVRALAPFVLAMVTP